MGRMIKKLSIFIIISGAIFIGIGTYQYLETTKAQDNALIVAREVLKKTVEKAEEKKNRDPSDPFQPEYGETVGILVIPKIDAELPIVEGTDEDELAKGVGHYTGTAYPTENDQIVLSGHRDTVFRKMGELEIGDEFIVQLPYGDFTYIIEDTKIVDADDRTVIKSTAPNEELVVTTCYPFSYVGNAPDRYIITAIPIEQNKSDL